MAARFCAAVSQGLPKESPLDYPKDALRIGGSFNLGRDGIRKLINGFLIQAGDIGRSIAE